MSKFYKQPVDIRMDGDTLAAFQWRGRWLHVVNCERIYQRRYAYDPYYGLDTFRVKVLEGGVYELVKDGANWVLERVWD